MDYELFERLCLLHKLQIDLYARSVLKMHFEISKIKVQFEILWRVIYSHSNLSPISLQLYRECGPKRSFLPS